MPDCLGPRRGRCRVGQGAVPHGPVRGDAIGHRAAELGALAETHAAAARCRLLIGKLIGRLVLGTRAPARPGPRKQTQEEQADGDQRQGQPQAPGAGSAGAPPPCACRPGEGAHLTCSYTDKVPALMPHKCMHRAAYRQCTRTCERAGRQSSSAFGQPCPETNRRHGAGQRQSARPS